MEVGAQGQQSGRDEFDKARIANQAGEFRAEVNQDIVAVVSLESCTILRLMKMDQQGHDFTQGQGSGAMTLDFAAGQHLFFKHGQEHLAKIIDTTEQFD